MSTKSNNNGTGTAAFEGRAVASDIRFLKRSVDLAALSRSVSMDWDDLARLASDPLVTIGSTTVNYPVPSNMRDTDARRCA